MTEDERLIVIAEMIARYGYTEESRHWSPNSRVWRIARVPEGAGDPDDFATVYARFVFAGEADEWTSRGEWQWSAHLGKKVPSGYTAALFCEIMRVEATSPLRPWRAAKEETGEAGDPPAQDLALVGG